MTAKLKAYTILEVTVAMLIASIGIAIAYTALTIVKSSYNQYHRKNEQLSSLVLADRLLKKDFSEAALINGVLGGVSMVNDSSVITYSFTPEYILRNQNLIRTDTLFIQTTDPVLTFEKRPATGTGKIDLLKLQAHVNGKLINMTYCKLYSSEDLFRQQ